MKDELAVLEREPVGESVPDEEAEMEVVREPVSEPVCESDGDTVAVCELEAVAHVEIDTDAEKLTDTVAENVSVAEPGSVGDETSEGEAAAEKESELVADELVLAHGDGEREREPDAESEFVTVGVCVTEAVVENVIDGVPLTVVDCDTLSELEEVGDSDGDAVPHAERLGVVETEIEMVAVPLCDGVVDVLDVCDGDVVCEPLTETDAHADCVCDTDIESDTVCVTERDAESEGDPEPH